MQKNIITIIVVILLTACGRSDDSSKYEGAWERVRKTSLADSQMIQIRKMDNYFAVKHFRSDDAGTVGIPDSAYFSEDGLLLLKNGGNILYDPKGQKYNKTN